MMSKKQLACMLALHIVYLLVGASIFYHIESPVEVAQRAEEKLERLEIQSKLQILRNIMQEVWPTLRIPSQTHPGEYRNAKIYLF